MANKKNFPVIGPDGNEYWISRSCAVCGILAVKDNEGNWCILANKRGPGCPDNVGKWNIPCGYLDYNETGAQAISREIFEETGVHTTPEMFKLIGVHYDLEGRQNVTHRYCAIFEQLNSIENFKIGKGTGGEENEVDDIRFVKLTELDNYDWAFGHKELVRETLMNYCSNNLVTL